MSDDTAAPVRPGDLIAGKYRVERVIGAGGMGVVVAAVHTELDQPVALKFILPRAVKGKDAVERFMREAWIGYIAPVTPQLILSNIAERKLGLPKSY